MATMAALMAAGAGLTWLGSRLRRGRLKLGVLSATRRTRQLECLERLPLTPSHSLHLIQADGRRLLVAVHPQGCTVLESGKAEAAHAG